MSKGTTGAAPAAAGMDDAALAQAASANGSFDDTGKDFKWEGKAPSELESSDKLGDMSMEDIEKEFGLDIPDRTRVAAPTGNMTVFEVEQAVADGTAEIPTEDAMAAAAVAALQPTAPAPAAVAADPAAAAAPAAAADPAAAAAPAAAAEEGEQVIESRDGKGRIPYAVLEAERQKNARLQAELDAERGKKQREAEDAAVQGALSKEEIEAMREEFPDAVVNAIEKLNNDNIGLKRENLDLKRGARGKEEQLSPEDVAQDLIDQDDMLSRWRTEHEQGNSANWNRAVRFDDMLREDPEWGKKTAAERFDQVRVLMGAPKPPPAPAKTEAQLAQDRADEAERKATAAAAARPNAPTHSDLPGGAPPAQDEQGRIGSLSIVELEKLVEAQGPDAFLAKFG